MVITKVYNGIKIKNDNVIETLSNQNNNPLASIKEENQEQQQQEIIDEKDDDSINESKKTYRLKIVWQNVFLMTFLHISAVYGIYLWFFYAKYQTLIFHITSIFICALGITCGAHRLWAHRSYEAALPLRIILMLLNSASLQNDIYEWVRDHRLHHKFSETDADPHNSRRGFFFAHMGWLLCRKHPDIMEKGKTISMADVEQDPVVRFQRKFYKPLAVAFTFLIPTWIAYYCWNEDYYIAFFLTMARYAFSLHATWTVNSVAHMYGNRPYDTTIQPVENSIVKYITLGEGYHNYHHVFPSDYSCSEISWTYDMNFSTWIIDSCANIGLVWNRKKVDHKMIMQRVQRTGDISMIEVYHQNKSHSLWWNTILPIIMCIFFFVFGTYLFRRYISFIYYLFTGIDNKWP